MSLMQSIPAPVLQAFKKIAPAHRKAPLDVRQLIFEVANLALTPPAFLMNLQRLCAVEPARPFGPCRLRPLSCYCI